MDKKSLKSSLFLITYCILLVAIIVKIDVVLSLITNGILVFGPLFTGIAIAFVLNRPYNFFLKKYKAAFSKGKFVNFSKPLAITTVYILFIGIVSGIIAFLIPQLSDSIKLLYTSIGDYRSTIESFVLRTANYLKLDSVNISGINAAIEKLPDKSTDFVTGLFGQIFNFTRSFLRTLIDIVISFILSVYLLADKERLKRQLTDVLRAYFPKAIAYKVIKVAKITSNTFTKFVSGQFTDAMILGTLCFVGMLIFGFDYPLLISVIIAITSLIPVAGAIVGCIPAVFILLMVNPMQAVWFLVFLLVLQQIEGNLIYPRIVGDSIGLPALWVLLAIIVGGGLFGILGMILGVPTVSVIYQLIKEDVNNRLEEDMHNDFKEDM